MNGRNLAKCHLGRHFAVAVTPAFPMLFGELGKPRFGYAEM
jgi:hypothetical protein